MSRVVILKGEGIRKEAVAGGAITPGHLVERSSATAVVVHATAAANAPKLFAEEAAAIGNGLTDAYASGDQVFMRHCHSGMEVNALVAASAAAIAVGDALESAGDGTLRVASTDAATDDTQRDAVVAYALEAVDNSGGGSPARIKVEIA